LTYCRAWKLNCDLASLHAKLRRLDPENGAVWLDDLGAAYAARDPTRINAALTEIGNAQRADSDGTRLVPVLYHALRDIGGADFADAYAWSAGNAGAMLNVEPLVALADLCADRGPPDATRTNACRRALLVFEHGDNFLYAAVGSAGATRLWPADSPEGRAARAIHRRTEYLERHAHLPMPSPAYLVLGGANYFERMVMPILRAETEYPREQDAWRAALLASRVTPDTRILF
ncbi:MAG: hypothetical protein KGI55_05745, partial [Gammaproteobacteria bacterium]|nr:hypothetical protein [Gammaproteobacteria bacterium]